MSKSVDVRQYIKKMRRRNLELNENWGTICTPVESLGKDGRKRAINCANTEGIFRIIQSIPSKKAEPFKLWLAKVGSDRIREIEDPELAQKRMKTLYEAKGYSKDWIDKRIRGIVVRQGLTDEWKARGVGGNKDFSILTSEISKATFDMYPSEYKKFKGFEAGKSSGSHDRLRVDFFHAEREFLLRLQKKGALRDLMNAWAVLVRVERLLEMLGEMPRGGLERELLVVGIISRSLKEKGDWGRRDDS